MRADNFPQDSSDKTSAHKADRYYYPPIERQPTISMPILLFARWACHPSAANKPPQTNRREMSPPRPKPHDRTLPRHVQRTMDRLKPKSATAPHDAISLDTNTSDLVFHRDQRAAATHRTPGSIPNQRQFRKRIPHRPIPALRCWLLDCGAPGVHNPRTAGHQWHDLHAGGAAGAGGDVGSRIGPADRVYSPSAPDGIGTPPIS